MVDEHRPAVSTRDDRPAGTSRTVGERLRSHRLTAGLSIEALAARAGVSERGISDIERGVSTAPRASTIAALADALGVSVDAREQLLAAARAVRGTTVVATDRARAAAPYRVPDFVGRAQELSAVLQRLREESAQEAPVVVITGPPGIGKTTMALEALHRLSPDGPAPLFADLGGVDAIPLSAAGVVVTLLRQLADAPADAPTGLDAALALWRTLSAGNAAPLLLDDASNESQVRAILGAGLRQPVVITSRRTLAGLSGVTRVALSPLAEPDGVSLLEHIIPADQRTAADLTELARLCDDMPLALRIAGNRIASRPQWSTADFVERMRDESRRLRTLVAGDLAVESAFATSYGLLSPRASALFRSLSLIPGAAFDARLASAALDLDVLDTEELLDELTDLGLVEARGGTRYALHDLLRLYAEQRSLHETDARAAADQADRVLSWLLTSAERAGAWFEPDRSPETQPDSRGLAFPDADTASAWLRAEEDNWFEAYRRAARVGRHDTVIDVADALHWFSDLWAGWAGWRELFSLSADAASAIDDDSLVATHLGYVAWTQILAEEYDVAAATAVRAQQAADRAFDASQSGWARMYEAWATLGAQDRSRIPELVADGVRFFEAAGDTEGTLQILGIGATYYRLAGRPQQALEQHRARLVAVRASTTLRENVARFTEADALISMAASLIDLDEPGAAIIAADEAIEIAETIGLTRRAIYIMTRATARMGVGDEAGAMADAEAATLVAEESGDEGLQEAVRSRVSKLVPAAAAAPEPVPEAAREPAPLPESEAPPIEADVVPPASAAADRGE